MKSLEQKITEEPEYPQFMDVKLDYLEFKGIYAKIPAAAGTTQR